MIISKRPGVGRTKYLIGAIGRTYCLLGIDIGGDSEGDMKRQRLKVVEANEMGYEPAWFTDKYECGLFVR